MKKLLVLLIGVLSVCAAECQNKEKIKQIVKLEFYIRQLEKGTEIVRKGLQTISDIKGGHLQLDQLFFAQLLSINPNIKSLGKVSDAEALHKQIVAQAKSCGNIANGSKWFSTDERNYVQNVIASLMDECDKVNQALTAVLTAGNLKMSDDSRLAVISNCSRQFEEEYSFVRAFASELKTQSVMREREGRGAKTLDDLMGN